MGVGGGGVSGLGAISSSGATSGLSANILSKSICPEKNTKMNYIYHRLTNVTINSSHVINKMILLMNIYTVYKLKYLQQGFTFSEVGHTINTLLDIGQVMLVHAVWLQL